MTNHMRDWSQGHSHEARAQGWDIFNVGSSQAPRYEIQRVDELAIFDGDPAARNYVVEAAGRGDPLASYGLSCMASEITLELGLNLDSLIDLTQLAAYRITLSQLVKYCDFKSMALYNRQLGNIPTALAYEEHCDAIYAGLPQWARTW